MKDAIKTASKRAVQKTAEATVDLIGNKTADKIMSVSKESTKELQNDETEVDKTSLNDRPKKKKEDTYLQKKNNKLLMNYGWYNNIIMEYQNIANLLENEASNQPSNFRTRN